MKQKSENSNCNYYLIGKTAKYNALAYAKANDDQAGENLQVSESKLRDADMADEIVRLSKANILEQAGVSVLTQANRGQDKVLQLLG